MRTGKRVKDSQYHSSVVTPGTSTIYVHEVFKETWQEEFHECAVTICCVLFRALFDVSMSCKRRMWLLMRNPDGTAIDGTMNSTSLSIGYVLVKHPTKRNHCLCVFVLRQLGIGRVFRKENLYETFLGFERVSERSYTVAELYRFPADLMLRTVITDVWVLRLPPFPSLWDDKTPQET